MTHDKLERLRPLLVRAYWASERPNEQRLVRMLGQVLFGVDMLYDPLPGALLSVRLDRPVNNGDVVHITGVTITV